jgi:predicted nucleic acid-binding protein
VLEFPRLTQSEKQYFENVFKILILMPINDRVIDKAIELRQQFKMKSNDSIIAATALLHEMVVYTRNVDDFKNITGLQIVNPIGNYSGMFRFFCLNQNLQNFRINRMANINEKA